MASKTEVVPGDLQFKHKEMRSSLFSFMRATFYRWAELWKAHCETLDRAPSVLGIGDLHIENFGTWRDAEGRLIWGVNDFDEACRLPYTNDLVRLTTSAYLAIRDEHLCMRKRDAAELILEGYVETLRTGGRPFVLDENNRFLRTIALAELRDPIRFWQKMRDLPAFRGKPAPERREALELLLADPGMAYQIKTRRAGLGSLGRVRLVAIGNWRGGLIAREIKAKLPPVWSRGRSEKPPDTYAEIIRRAVRVPDPFLATHGNWIVRRLAPDCSRIELASLPLRRDEGRILYAMGSETANIHLGSASIKVVLRDINQRPALWLHRASKLMSEALSQDWKALSSRQPAASRL